MDAAGIATLAGQWGVNPGRVNQLEDLANRWEQLSGYQVKLPDWMLGEMAQQPNVATLYDVGQYMAGHTASASFNVPGATIISEQVGKQMPWAFVGMRAEDYQARVSSFQSVYKDLIGRDASQQELNKAFAIGKGETSASDLRQNLQQDETMQSTYGWLKFGLNFQGFERTKADYRTRFGTDISDDQAVLQLKYDHALGHVLGAYQTAQLEPVGQAQSAQQRPNPGISALQSAVR